MVESWLVLSSGVVYRMAGVVPILAVCCTLYFGREGMP